MFGNALGEKLENPSTKSGGLSVMELIRLATHRVITEEDIVQMQERLAEAEVQYEEEAQKRRINPEWLERRYTI